MALATSPGALGTCGVVEWCLFRVKHGRDFWSATAGPSWNDA